MLQRSGRVVGLIEPCLPSPAKAPPSGSDWLHEIKHDGFRILDTVIVAGGNYHFDAGDLYAELAWDDGVAGLVI